jgi:hypothetical protein
MKVLIAANKGHVTEVEMIKGLRAAGVDIYAAFASDSPHLSQLRAAGIPTRQLDLKTNIDFANALKIRRWIEDEGFNIVHGLANRQVAKRPAQQSHRLQGRHRPCVALGPWLLSQVAEPTHR